MTKPHKDKIVQDGKEHGYSLRVGKSVPKNSANLAYVHSPKIAPKENVHISDLTYRIRENMSTFDFEQHKAVYPDKDFLLRELDGDYRFPTPDITITDEYSIPETTQDRPEPLYYQAELKGLFDVTNARVHDYLGGYIDTPIARPKSYSEYMSPKPNFLLYLGSKIKITNLDGTDISSKLKYKIKLIQQEGTGVPKNAYRIVLYTNFRSNSKETYLIRYEKYNNDGTHTADYTEVLNAYPFFTKESKSTVQALADSPKVDGQWKAALDDKIYAVEENKDGDHLVYAPSRVVVADQDNARPAEQFKYRITANLETRFNKYKQGTLRIGVANLNSSVANVEDLSGVVKKLYESRWKPHYLDFENPHPPEGHNGKRSAEYWKVDLTIHAEMLDEYDIILLPGYGVYDMVGYTEALRTYLQNGGRLWIDNNGTGSNVLELRNFLANIKFSTTEVVTKAKGPGTKSGDTKLYLDRLYAINDSTLTVGYPQINPKIVYGSGETADGWSSIVRYGDNDHSIMHRDAFSRGKLIVSNCGIAKAILHDSLSGDTSTKIAINVLLSSAEHHLVQTPWLHDYVHHKDNLFKEEYQRGMEKLYFDAPSDSNNRQIVAKKIISRSVKDALIPYVGAEYHRATGTYKLEVQSDSAQHVTNSDFEITNATTSQWITSTTDAIPGWNTHIVGDGYLAHVSDVVQRGSRSIKVSAPSNDGVAQPSQIFWSQNKEISELGSYTLSAWIKTANISAGTTSGVTISVYSGGTKLVSSTAISGTRDWEKVSVTVGIAEAKTYQIRIGFTDGTAYGTVWCDGIELSKRGSVEMTYSSTPGNGNDTLYAYTVRANRNGFNFKNEGFSRSDITIYDRYVEALVKINPFVYVWNNDTNEYDKKYDTSTQGKVVRIRKSNGVVNLGLVTTLLPELREGQDWANKDNVFFELSIEPAHQSDNDDTRDNRDYLFVNAGFFDTARGQFTGTKDGKFVVAFKDVFHPQIENSEDNFIVKVWTNYYTIRATRRRYSILLDYKDQIKLDYPATIDERDAWYLRIKNGRFTVRKMDYYRYVKHYRGRTYYSQPAYWQHYSYSIPEYTKQVFYPSEGYKRVKEEVAEYINDYTIRVQNSPLYVKIDHYNREPAKKVSDSNYSDGRSRYYKLPFGNIIKTKPVEVYVKEVSSLDFIQVSTFDVDYENGLVIFEEGVNGEVEVTFDRENLQVFRRRYGNNSVAEEVLQSYDNKTYISKHQNWMAFPTPRIYTEGAEGKELVPVSNYKVDYSTGSITFYNETPAPVYATYTHSLNQGLRIRDYDIQSGLIYLESPIDFKDEIYVNYFFEEQYLEYRGYYDEVAKRFIKLDLNPSEGHYCTVRNVRYDQSKGKIVIMEDVPTSKLLNKEIYVYLLPHKQGSEVVNKDTVRHCFSRREWEAIEKTTPQALLLGVVHVRENTSVDSITVMDARTRGGGLKSTITKQQVEKKSISSTSYWDIGPFDGIAYYTNGVLMIQLPKSILKREGGQFSEKEVNDIIRKYIAFGIYYNIEYV